jgi:glycosyltransferase involved in cell wall biosynthesis
MKTKRKILFVLPDLNAGGAERVISFVSMGLNPDLFESKLVVLGFEKDTVYEVENVEVQYLAKTRLLKSILELIKIIRKERPYFVVSSIIHINIIMGIFSFFFLNIKFIGREASVVSKMGQFSKINSKISLILIKMFYPRLSTIICQSDDMREDFVEVLGIKPHKLILINNPITISKTIIRNSTPNYKIHFVTVGRLSEEKGYLRIIRGLSKIINYDFHYTIIGSGVQEKLINEAVNKNMLADKVTFIPYTSEILEIVGQKDVFLQGSIVEGFPNALLESCSVGTPVVAFNAPGGTKDIVINGRNGFLVENEEEFASVLNNINALTRLDRADVIASVVDKFSAEKIIGQYEELFNNL